ncbi:MAG TPA: Hsp20/alpha crystallin family protein [Longimicrobium sp.]|nr:Hsp20/alpha crystallin family protein [Longimicrobium sp.]
MAIVPYRSATELFRPFFENFLETGWGGRMAGMDLLRTPSADVMETDDEIRVTVELPGMRRENIEVSMENNVLTITGEKKEERREQDENDRWHLAERRYGRFTRSFVLPAEVESERIQAHFQDGVLHVAIPKSEKARPRRIEIRGGDDQRQLDAGSSR